MDEVRGIHREVGHSSFPPDAQARIDKAFILRGDTRTKFGADRFNPESKGSQQFGRVQKIVSELGAKAQEDIRINYREYPQEKLVNKIVQYGQWMDLGVLKAKEEMQVREMQDRLHMTNNDMIPVLEGYLAEKIVEGQGTSVVAAIEKLAQLKGRNTSDPEFMSRYIDVLNKERNDAERSKEPPGQEFDGNMSEIGYEWNGKTYQPSTRLSA